MSEIAAIVAGAQYEIRRLQEREHIIAAVLKGIDRFDEVALAVRSAHRREDVRNALMRLLDVDEFQAMAVADMQVRMLSGQRCEQLADEHEAVAERIAELESVLASPEELVGTGRRAWLAARAESA